MYCWGRNRYCAVSDGQSGTSLTMETAEALFQDKILYKEAGDTLFPVPRGGAYVWVNSRSSDGFVLARDAQVPGCSLDFATNFEWYETAGNMAGYQTSDSLVNFNTAAVPYPDSNLWELDRAWLRGHVICSNNPEPLYDYFGPSSDPQLYVKVNEDAWQCPVNYVVIENLAQCREASNYLGATTFVDSFDFVNWVSAEPGVDMSIFTYGCQILPSVQQIRNSLWGQYNFNPDTSIDKTITMNPDITRNSSNVWLRNNERFGSQLHGQPLCVKMSHQTAQEDATYLYIQQRTEIASATVYPNVAKQPQAYWLQKQIELSMSCSASSCNGNDTPTWFLQINEDTLETIKQVTKTTLSNIMDITADHFEINLEKQSPGSRVE